MRSSTVTCLLSFDRPTNNCPYPITSPANYCSSTVSDKQLRASLGESHIGPGLVFPEAGAGTRLDRGRFRIDRDSTATRLG
jgi:hypothetical protein